MQLDWIILHRGDRSTFVPSDIKEVWVHKSKPTHN
jgi:hypothetical protein